MAKKKIVEELVELPEEDEEVRSFIKIKIGKEDAFIWSDKRQWMWGYKTMKARKKGDIPVETYEAEGYYSTLQGMLNGILEKKLRLSEYNSFSDLVKTVKELRDEMNGIFDTTVRDDQAFVVPSLRKRDLENDGRRA